MLEMECRSAVYAQIHSHSVESSLASPLTNQECGNRKMFVEIKEEPEFCCAIVWVLTCLTVCLSGPKNKTGKL